MIPAVRDFVSSILGKRFVAPPPFDLASAFKESAPSVPLLFVLSPGSDPMSALMKFAGE